MLKKFRLGSLRQRIGMIVVIHALLMVGSIALVIRGLSSTGDRIWIVPEAERVADIVTAFERARPDTYEDLVRAIRDDRTEVQMLSNLPAPMPLKLARAGRSDEISSSYRDALAGRPFRIEADGKDISEDLDNQSRYSTSAVRVYVSLPNGLALEIERTTPAPLGRFLSNLSSFAAIVILLDVLIIYWLASQTTRPVDVLVRAVRRDDRRAMLLKAPLEFAELGKAFHDLRERLQSTMEERTRIIAAIAHDFRTYLTRLELRSDFVSDDEQRKLIFQDLHEMRQLMDDALTFARPETSDEKDRYVDLIPEIRRAAEACAAVGCDIVVTTGEPALLDVSPVSFQRMMSNLLENAVRYGGGSIQVRWERFGKMVRIIVEDEGPGVPEDRIEDIIKPFARLEESRARHTGGVGLGLSIVQALAHRAGGTSNLENREGIGLRVNLDLPLKYLIN